MLIKNERHETIIQFGGAVVLSEATEMFGAEHLLMRRC